MNIRKLGVLAPSPSSRFLRAAVGRAAATRGRSRSGRHFRARGPARPRPTRSSTRSTWRSRRRAARSAATRSSYKDIDDSTAAAGKWDEATEIKNANDAVANDKLVAYIGTFNSGAAKLSIPILCGKGIVMVSPANTGVGLTKPAEAGEPDKYYPNGCKKNYTRVIPNDLLGQRRRQVGRAARSQDGLPA